MEQSAHLNSGHSQHILEDPLNYTIDDFLNFCDKNRLSIAENFYHNDLNINVSIPRTYSDAEAIVEIYRKVYRGTYPFHEMLDVDYIFDTFTNEKYYWRLFKLENKAIDTESIIGCYTIVVDRYEKSAYLRGMNVIPEYQGIIGIKKLMTYLLNQFLRIQDGKVEKWYNEARTAHAKIQNISRYGGAYPLAFFEGKDHFFNINESEVLFISHSSDALTNKRLKPVNMHSCLKKLYDNVKEIFHFHENPHIEDCHFIPNRANSLRINKKIDEILVSCKEDQFGYKRLEFIHIPTGDYFKAVHTLSVRNIEKINYSCKNLENFIAFLILLKKYAKNEQIEYIEFQIPVSYINATTILLEHGFLPCGYVPSWKRSLEKPEFYEDYAIFSCTKKAMKIKPPILIPETQVLYNIIQQDSNHDNSVSVYDLIPNLLSLSQ